jgi:hypothetical protein
MHNIEIAYRNHLRLLSESPIQEHRDNALAIARSLLLKKRASHFASRPKTSPYLDRWAADLKAFDDLIATLS